ncbi:Endonuclease, Uma2 family (restriction endonuclease fold) [Butyrivibrio sp. ob235]|uniref:Uma2 family endonuclease n=1 Tax=Butyrivibrio sp. ob235 TaxID=1761780 RepID=UPI0008D24B9F|nr:Uma2 family endonuclease [Butyrivibrio sp. ob235]SEM60251.1 Endonuclease, Uma2 family (restriction endonuclease fold) [Butyrivibrio sp. ob235]
MTIDEMKQRRREFGYSYKKLSELSGVPLGTIQKIFNGETKSPRHDTIVMLQKVLEPDSAAKESYRFKSYGDGKEKKYGAEGEHYENLREEPAIIYGSKKKVDLEHFNGKKQGEYTIEDYEALPDDVRVELIDGYFFYMDAPSTRHQLIGGEIYAPIRNYIRKNKGKCIPFISPTDVQLDRDDRTILEPDVFIVCDPSKITEKRIYGNPDFVVEIISPSTARKDRFIKAKKYKYAGVKEFWLVDSKKRNVLVYSFDDEDNDDITIYGFGDKIPIGLYDGKLQIDFADIAEYVDSICGPVE